MKLDRTTLQAWALASEVGCSIAFFLAGSVFGGILLDKYLHTRPIFLLIGIFLGLALAGYSLYRLVMFRTPGDKRSSGRPDKNDV